MLHWLVFPLRSLRQGSSFAELKTSLRHGIEFYHTRVSFLSVSSRSRSSGFSSESMAASMAAAANVDGAAAATAASSPASASDTLSVGACVAAFRGRGHLLARLDPLNRGADGSGGRGVWLGEEQGGGASSGACSRSRAWEDERLSRLLAAVDGEADDEKLSEAACDALGLSASAASATFDLGAPLPPPTRATAKKRRPASPLLLVGGPPFNRRHWRLAPLVRSLAASYCGTLALETDHLSPERAAWLIRERERLPARPPRQERRRTLRMLSRAAAFESFLASRFPSSKRFGLEGLDALAPGLLAAADELSLLGVKRLNVGTPHRGRLSLLAAVLRTPAGQIFAEMEAAQSEWHVGDVKYHLGKGATLEFDGEDDDDNEDDDGGGGEAARTRSLHVSVAPNPSHLEAVGPVVLGMVRAQQASFPGGTSAVAPLLVHGDAAFAGLGVVFETLQMADVPGFGVGGTVHVRRQQPVRVHDEPRIGEDEPAPDGGGSRGRCGGPARQRRRPGCRRRRREARGALAVALRRRRGARRRGLPQARAQRARRPHQRSAADNAGDRGTGARFEKVRARSRARRRRLRGRGRRVALGRELRARGRVCCVQARGLRAERRRLAARVLAGRRSRGPGLVDAAAAAGRRGRGPEAQAAVGADGLTHRDAAVGRPGDDDAAARVRADAAGRGGARGAEGLLRALWRTTKRASTSRRRRRWPLGAWL